MLIYSNKAHGKISGDTDILQYSAIEGYTIIAQPDGYTIYAQTVGGNDIALIVMPSYDQAVAIVEKIEREAEGDAPKIDLRFLQLNPGGR